MLRLEGMIITLAIKTDQTMSKFDSSANVYIRFSLNICTFFNKTVVRFWYYDIKGNIDTIIWKLSLPLINKHWNYDLLKHEKWISVLN